MLFFNTTSKNEKRKSNAQKQKEHYYTWILLAGENAK